MRTRGSDPAGDAKGELGIRHEDTVVVTADGPVLVEGNWGAGVFENKPTATGIRHGHLPRYRAAMGF